MNTAFDAAQSPMVQPSYAHQVETRHGFRTFLVAALIALIPIVGGGASAIYVAHRRDPQNFDLGEACGAAFISLLSALGFFLGIAVIFAVFAAIFAAVA